MKNFLPLLSPEQKQELKQRVALELYIENFSREDLFDFLENAPQEKLTQFALQLNEEKSQAMTQKALTKYEAIAEDIVNIEEDQARIYLIQLAQILSDFGTQHYFVK